MGQAAIKEAVTRDESLCQSRIAIQAAKATPRAKVVRFLKFLAIVPVPVPRVNCRTIATECAESTDAASALPTPPS